MSVLYIYVFMYINNNNNNNNMVVGVLKHRQTFLDLRRALQLDQIVASPRPLWLSMAG